MKDLLAGRPAEREDHSPEGVRGCGWGGGVGSCGHCDVLLPGLRRKFEYSGGIPAGNQNKMLVTRTFGLGPKYTMDLA